jgi:hypothetical protein
VTPLFTIVVIVILCLGGGNPAEQIKERSLWKCGEVRDEDRRLSDKVGIMVIFIIIFVV